MKKNILTAAEIEDIKMKTGHPINTERQNAEDTRVKLENLTQEQNLTPKSTCPTKYIKIHKSQKNTLCGLCKMAGNHVVSVSSKLA